MSSVERRRQNEAMFRAVNRKVEELNDVFETVGAGPGELFCECDRLECQEHVRIGVEEYERICDRAGWYIVKPGHEDLEVERVVERGDEFNVVDKL